MSTGRPKEGDIENPPPQVALFSPPTYGDDEWGFHDHGTPSGISPNRYYQRSPQVVPLTESPSASFSYSAGDEKSDNDIQGPPPIIRSRGVFLSDEERKIQRKKDITVMIGFPEYTPDMNEYHKRVVEKLEILFQQGRITAEERDEAIADSAPSKCDKALQTTSDILTCQPIWWFARWFSQRKAKKQGGRKTRRRRRKRKRRKTKRRRRRRTKKRKSKKLKKTKRRRKK